MAKMNLLQAINNALITAMTEDEKVMVFGEDVGHFGGVFQHPFNVFHTFQSRLLPNLWIGSRTQPFGQGNP